MSARASTGGRRAATTCGLATTVRVALALLLASPLCALEVPFLAGRVNDLAGMIDAGRRARLEQTLAAFEQETGAQVVVLTVPSLEGDPIEDFSIRVADTWKLGREDVDDGALLLVAQAERRLRIEVGYGLEGALTDAKSRRILDGVITPRFRAGDYSGGIEAGVEAMLAVIRGEDLPPPTTVAPTAVAPGCFFLLALFFFLIMLAVVVSRLSRSGRGWSSRRGGWIAFPTGTFGGGGRSRSGSWGGFSGGGGFGGFSGGGGGFGGGGASGSW